MNNLALLIGNVALYVFCAALIGFIVVYAPMLFRRPSSIGWTIMGGKLALLLMGVTVLARNFVPDLPALAILRLIIFLAVIAYLVFDFVQLVVARRVARGVSPKPVIPDVPIVEPEPTDEKSD